MHFLLVCKCVLLFFFSFQIDFKFCTGESERRAQTSLPGRYCSGWFVGLCRYKVTKTTQDDQKNKKEKKMNDAVISSRIDIFWKRRKLPTMWAAGVIHQKQTIGLQVPRPRNIPPENLGEAHCAKRQIASERQ